MDTTAPPPKKSSLAFWAILIFFLCNIVLFSSLGIWQIQRLGWKKELIARIESRTQAPAGAAPPQAQWASLNAENAEYRHIALQGQLLRDQEVAVYTSTELGAGYWVMAPMLVGPQGAPEAIVWVNRGFAPTDLRLPIERPEQAPASEYVQITGLLRLPDRPHPFLRENVPQENRWYRRIPQEFSAARALPALPTAPYFIHARTSTTSNPWPRADMPLTQQLRNNHLGYALTWFTLALMNVAAVVFLLYNRRKTRSATVAHT